MERRYPNTIYKHKPECKQSFLAETDLMGIGELLISGLKQFVPIDFAELYLYDTNRQTQLWFSTLQASDKRDHAVCRKVVSYIGATEEIFRFPYYDRDKYPDIHYSEVLELGSSFIAFPWFYEHKVVGAVVLASKINQIFRDDIIPLLAAHIASWDGIYKSIFAYDDKIKTAFKTQHYLQQLTMPVFAVNNQCNLIYFNSAFEEFIRTHYSAQEIKLNDSLKAFTGNDFPAIEELIQTAWRHQSASKSFTFLIAGKENVIGFDAYRIEEQILVFCRNIEKQELHISSEPESINNLYKELPFAVFLADRNSEIVYHNAYFEKLMGRNVCGSSLLEFIHSTQIKNYFRLLADLFHGASNDSDVSLLLSAPNQNRVTLTGSFKKLIYRNQEALAFLGSDLFSKDIISNDYLVFSPSALLQSIPLAVAITNEQFAASFVNQAFSTLFGKSLNDIQNLSLPDMLLNLDAARLLTEEISALPENQTLEKRYRITTSDGSVKDIICSIATTHSGTHKHYVFTFYDISAWEEEKRRVTEQAQAAIEAQQAEEQFLARMSHEIRTAMNGIIGLTNVMMQSGISGEQRQFLHLIKQSTDNLLVIINDILDLSKIKSGKLQFEEVPVQLNVLFENLYSVVLSKLGAKEVHLKYEYDDDIPAMLNTDPVRINQILLNLLGNAVKFTERGQITYSAKLLGKDEHTARVLIEVSDTGIGIEEKDAEHIFESYKQADSSTTRKYGGTGLGLPIVKQLVELLGGHISVKSRVGKGTTFSIELPFTINKETIVETPAQTAEIEVPEGITVLVVDDNYINRLLVVHLLKSKGFQVLEASGGYEALDILHDEDVDVVLMDISMPDIDGFETTRIIRKSDKAYIRQVPVIAMTAHGFQDQIRNATDAGMNSYIVKPFKPEQLYQTILEQLNIDANAAQSVDEIKDSDEQSREDSTYSKEERNSASNSAGVRNYDLAFLEDYYDHEPTFINNILKLYVQDTPGMLKEMEQSMLDGDWKQFKALAHKIKTNVMMMGIKPVDDFFKASSALDATLSEHPDMHLQFYSFKLTVLNALDQIKADRDIA